MNKEDLRCIKNQLNLLADKEYNSNGDTEALQHIENAIKEITKALLIK